MIPEVAPTATTANRRMVIQFVIVDLDVSKEGAMVEPGVSVVVMEIGVVVGVIVETGESTVGEDEFLFGTVDGSEVGLCGEVVGVGVGIGVVLSSAFI
jgi:hypothetical protein